MANSSTLPGTPWLRQTATVTLFNLRTLGRRSGSSAATVFGVAGVVMVLVGVLSMAVGFERTMTSTGDPESVIVMRSGSDSEMTSGLSLDATKIIADTKGVARGASGAVASAELFVIVDVAKKSTGTGANVPLRGVQPTAFEVRSSVEFLEGRNFEPGKREIIVGASAAREFDGLEVGRTLKWGENEWTVAGIFTTGGTVEDSEIWCDARVLQPAYRRGSSFQSVHLRLESADDFDAFAAALADDPRVDVKVVSESAYYSEQSEVMTSLITNIGYLIGVLMGFGAVFGALNTMYTAISARAREIATLRAIGFSSSPVVVSVVIESMVLATAGGLLGAGLAYFLFNGARAATLNYQTFSQVAFAFAVTPQLMAMGISYAILMGLAGGLFPAIRAARQPVATGLRGF